MNTVPLLTHLHCCQHPLDSITIATHQMQFELPINSRNQKCSSSLIAVALSRITLELPCSPLEISPLASDNPQKNSAGNRIQMPPGDCKGT